MKKKRAKAGNYDDGDSENESNGDINFKHMVMNRMMNSQ